MKVYVVGSGCTWFERNNTSFILDDDTLFDAPENSYKDIIKVQDIFKLKGIFISHFHADHFFAMYIISTRIMRESEKKGRTEKLKVYGPKGILDELVLLNKTLHSGPDACDKESLQKHIEFIEVGNGDEFEYNGYKVKVFAMDHGPIYSQGYTFTDKNGKTIAFTADTRDCDNLRKMLSTADVVFIDVAAMNKHFSHLDVYNFLELTKLYTNCKFYPIHTSDETQEFITKNNLNAVNDKDTFYF